jgi:hypothetical protein
MQKQISILLPNSSKRNLLLMLHKEKDIVKIAWALGDLNLEGEEVGDDYFDCMIKIRARLEEMNIKMLCNAARYDVYPSRMLRQMGKGVKGYRLTLGNQASEKDLVDIFEVASGESIGTVQQQQEYYNKWLDSLR